MALAMPVIIANFEHGVAIDLYNQEFARISGQCFK